MNINFKDGNVQREAGSHKSAAYPENQEKGVVCRDEAGRMLNRWELAMHFFYQFCKGRLNPSFMGERRQWHRQMKVMFEIYHVLLKMCSFHYFNTCYSQVLITSSEILAVFTVQKLNLCMNKLILILLFIVVLLFAVKVVA